MMQSTMTSASQTIGSKFKEVLKMKLSYEWKKIYRILSMQDAQASGLASISAFEKAAIQCGVYLTKEDMARTLKLYHGQDDPGMINYQRISVELGMHLQSFDFLQKNHSRHQDIQRLRILYSAVEKHRPLYDAPGSTLNLIRTNQDQKKGSLTPDRSAKVLDRIIDDPINRSAVLIDPRETPQKEIREILLRKMKNFRDLILLHQKKSSNGGILVPIQEFKTILKSLGINISHEVTLFPPHKLLVT